jgi:hypothetical protein
MTMRCSGGRLTDRATHHFGDTSAKFPWTRAPPALRFPPGW